jgi:hypothetical protein
MFDQGWGRADYRSERESAAGGENADAAAINVRSRRDWWRGDVHWKDSIVGSCVL